ncbi:MAG TPA: DUF4139 domain-containing protein [Puia sp.]|nr:DUF4139 domain-containing protein [Puia sp.]
MPHLSAVGLSLGLALCLHAVKADPRPAAGGGGSPVTVSATLRSVTVYRTGAEMVHTATAQLDQGNNELIIDHISNYIDPNSIRISCSGNVTIMSAAFSSDYLKQETPHPVVKKLQDSVAVIKAAIGRLEALTSADNEQLDLLNANKSIGGSTAGVTVADLNRMLDYYRQKVLDLRTELNSYQDRSTQLKEQLARVEDQIKEEEQKNAKIAGFLTLQLLSPLAGPCDLTISYVTTAAHWDPSYDLRVGSTREPLELLYKAQLVQTSGIDWKQVKLHLSTSTPARNNNAPTLRTRFLRFDDPVADALGPREPMADRKYELNGSVAGVDVKPGQALNDVVVVGYGAPGGNGAPEYTEPLYIVNGREIGAGEYRKIDPRAFKHVDHLKGDEAISAYGARGGPGVYVATLKDELGDYVTVSDKTVDVVFDIDLPYDVPTNGKQQGVVLKEYKLPCTYAYFAAPGLDKGVYLLGQVLDWEKLNLLPGEANLIVEGTLIGRSKLDPNSTQDTLNLTLGVDKRIVVRRDKVAEFSSVKFLGSSKKEIFTYEITVRNNKQEKIQLLLKDQYPISSNKDIEEELLESSGAAVDKETGILTWKLDMAAGETRKIRLSYSIRYPKDKSLYIHP